jgi:hypothetical protein
MTFYESLSLIIQETMCINVKQFRVGIKEIIYHLM